MSENNSFHDKSVENTLDELDAHAKDGLSDGEAEERLEKHGPNKLRKTEKKSIWQMLLSQINNPVIYLLMAAVAASLLVGDVEEAIAILVVIVLNTAIGFWMEYQAQQSMKALKEMDRITAKVIRNKEEKEVDAENLVPGDILLVDAGDMVGADARIIESKELEIDESALTGESVPVSKSEETLNEDTSLADRNNTIYKGTAVTNGKAKAVVVAIGMDSEIGHISSMVEESEEEEVPLNRKLKSLTKKLIWVTLGLAGAYFIVGYFVGTGTYKLIQTAIAWTVAAIPEGLPIVASIALARGMLKLADRHVIVKQLAAVETLGETTLIFTDKTGTLTFNRLSVKKFHFPDGSLTIETEGNDTEIQNEKSSDSIPIANKILTLCNDASLEENNGGDPLEIASLKYVKKFDRDKYRELRELNREMENPFDSDTMVMGTIHKDNNEHYFLSAKGATEKLIDRCTQIFKNNETQGLEDKEYWKEKNDELADEGLRVLALAFRKLDQLPDEDDEWLSDLVLVGLIGYQDPPREDVKSSIDTCSEAGIKVVMVTGDHPSTAEAIGEQVGILSDDKKGEVSISLENQNLDDAEIIGKQVFSRVDPSQKLEIVSQFQKNNEIVAMTGDGVNDAPALKKADIGIAMGKRGTQVAQEAADMVLKDDSFESIVLAVRQGRIIFGNIRKFITYQLSYHLAEILIIASISFSLYELPLLPLQLLFLNLLSDVFPALALGVGPGNPAVMQQSPKDKNEPMIPLSYWLTIGVYGFIIAISVSGAYFYAHYALNYSPSLCNNVAFFSLALAQLWHVFNMRENDEHPFFNQVTKNKFIWMAVTLCLSVLTFSYFEPSLKSILSFTDMPAAAWGLIAITSILPTVIIQVVKFFRNDRLV